MSDPRFLPHNTHLEDPELFETLDPQLRLLKRQHYVYQSPLLNEFPTLPGIYTLGGGRQIGKSTLLKQWMLKLLKMGTPPTAIMFISGELIDDHHSLLHILTNALNVMPNTLRYILIDEVTYIKDWDKAIKYAADAGLLENTIVMLTGSDLALIQEARLRFPGRRGQSSIINFHMYPLSFKETVILKHGQIAAPFENELDLLFKAFNEYLIHGGYLTAINDLALHHTISNATLTTYSEWIRGDMIKRGKHEHYLREILSAIFKRYNSQVTWNALAKDLSIDHPKTVSDYAAALESMDALFIQAAILEDKLIAAPKKGKKLIFTDPFIFHALRAWIWPQKDAFESQIKPAIENNELSSKIVEASVATLYRREYPTYYIKAEGEVDIAYVNDNKFWPIEIKWRNQLREKDLKQILKYPNGRIFSKNKTKTFLQETPIEPLPLALFNL